MVTVVSGSPAEKAGLKAGTTDQSGAPGKGGDVITAIDSTTVKSVSDLQNYLANKNVGDTVTLTLNRGGTTTTAGVIVWPMPLLALMAVAISVALALVASFFPARRAARLDPCATFQEV